MEYILIFIATIIVDIAWTLYLIKVEERKAVQSGVWAVVIYLIGALVVLSYSTNHYLLIPAVIGSFIGTAGTVWYKKRKENLESKV
jgi:predicted membrane channel-forming protein YqfA (hemolysin III family)